MVSLTAATSQALDRSPSFISSPDANSGTAVPTKPNIVLFLVDDMGWQDTSVPFWNEPTPFNRHYHTPSMERLAQQGIRFTDAYAHTVCSPSRTSIMTGQNPARHHVTQWTLWSGRDQSDGWGRVASPPKWRTEGLQPQDVTLSKLLHEAGYFTIHCGKAHWGAFDTDGSNPLNLGFDINIAGHAAGGPGSYQGLENFGNAEKGHYTKPWGVPGLENYHGQDINLTDALTQEATEHLKKSGPHRQTLLPLYGALCCSRADQPHHRFLENYENRTYSGTSIPIPPVEQQYASMVEGMDSSLGVILDQLNRLGRGRKHPGHFYLRQWRVKRPCPGTLNSPRDRDNTHNWPLRAGKGSAYEGGNPCPFHCLLGQARFRESPARTIENQAWAAISSQPILIEDLFPTLLGVAGALDFIPADYKVDGRDLRRFISRQASDLERPLYFHYPHVWGPHGPGYEPHSSIHLGEWKAILFL